MRRGVAEKALEVARGGAAVAAHAVECSGTVVVVP
jgi:hypothetical protein